MIAVADRREVGAPRWWALGAVSLAVLAVGLDGTILSVALPTLAHSLHASESDLQWFSSGYLLVLASAMLPAGLVGDRYGRKRVMLAALALFGAGSAACAAAPSSDAFIAARVVLGLAGAGVIVMSLLAAAALVPESRAHRQPGMDPVGVLASVAGLVALTYGLIEAGRDGWGDAAALLEMAAGVAVLVAFFAWERALGRRPGGDPLVDLALFHSRSYTWGVILVAIAVVAMIGVLFTMPQFFQGVMGTDAMGSGVRLLPLIGGLVAGAIPADRIAGLLGARLTVALGFASLAAGLGIGATTRVSSGDAFVAVWMALIGVGIGLGMTTATSAALSELSEERSGVGSAVLQALNKMGGPLGTAILGSVLSSAYLARVDVSGLPAPAAGAVRQSLFAGVAVAKHLRSPALLRSVRAAFVHRMDLALVVSAGVAVAGLVLAAVFLPRGTAPRPRTAARQ